ncbi:MAG TPA: hypothetical protein VHP33_29640 [Polyangiaceae bacterium]|nr:hypothetical protein [Polyangiaceae bacterium]
MEIHVDAEGAPWILGLEWFWGGAPGVTASYLAHREAGGWRREAPPCAGEAVVDHLVDLGGEQWLLCGSSLLSRPPGAEFRLRLEDALYDGELAVVAGKLLVQKGGGWFEVVEAGARPSPAE